MNNKKNLFHDSALKHVTGEAKYICDLNYPEMLFGKVVYSQYARAEIISCNIEKALKLKGVESILTYRDVPGKNQMGPVFHDELCLVEKVTQCSGQAIVLIAAESETIAYKAASLIEISYRELDPILSIEAAKMADSKIAPTRKIEKGNIEDGFQNSEMILEGNFSSGAQEHWYLETQAAVAVPGEGNEITIFASSQNPGETQIIVSEVLGIDFKDVVCEVRRMGGGFGGKETQGNHVAAWASLLAVKTGKPVIISLFRDDDQIMTGKRHPFFSSYKIGFNRDGKINAYEIDLNADAGHAADLSMAILERAMLHSDNAYHIPNVKITATAWKTNYLSNTAFRGFGAPQGIAVIELAIERMARLLYTDASLIRKLNFYSTDIKGTTPYGQIVDNSRLEKIYNELLASSDYKKRKENIDNFNSEHIFVKRGIALVPVKFGISFTTAFLNQAGATVNIYRDGTLQVNHGGVEMGQGLNTKMWQIAAAELGVSLDRIVITPTNTSKVPNASATAASSGADLNGMAVKNAIDILKSRLIPLAKHLLFEQFQFEEQSNDSVNFENDFVFYAQHPESKIAFNDLITKAYLNQISLSANGFYKTPDIYFDREKGQGKPFHYFSYGMSVTEVEVDVLTGSHKICRTDILHDVGDSLNENIDLGQVSGAFVQGMGWVTTEEIKWDKNGKLLTCSPDTYKIPASNDIPEIFNIKLLENAANENTIRKSKAVGEPPFVLAFSVWLAIRYAVSSVAEHKFDPQLEIPATHEKILLAIEELKEKLRNEK
jgi:xanthine dehydrogenase molybdopterin binding subunit